MRFKATSLLETIIASLIFLLVFGIALDTITSVNRFYKPDWVGMERDFNAFRDSILVQDGVRNYSWGRMEWHCNEVINVSGVNEIQVDVTMRGGYKVIYKYIVNE